MARDKVHAVELEIALAGTDTAAKPRSEALDRSGKLTFEYPSTQYKAVDAVMALGYDVSTGEAFSLRVLVERVGPGVKREKKAKA
jgi:hypothetical protein